MRRDPGNRIFLNLPRSLRALGKANEPNQLSDSSSPPSTALRRESLGCCAVAHGAAEGQERAGSDRRLERGVHSRKTSWVQMTWETVPSGSFSDPCLCWHTV